jgi:excisionase family DNA binding protein
VRPVIHPDPNTPTDGLRLVSGQANAPWRTGLPDPRFKPYLLTSEVAELLHASPKTVGTWAKQGKLPYLRTLGGHRRYPTDPILRLAAGLSTTLRPKAPRGAGPDVRRSAR